MFFFNLFFAPSYRGRPRLCRGHRRPHRGAGAVGWGGTEYYYFAVLLYYYLIILPLLYALFSCTQMFLYFSTFYLLLFFKSFSPLFICRLHVDAGPSVRILPSVSRLVSGVEADTRDHETGLLIQSSSGHDIVSVCEGLSRALHGYRACKVRLYYVEKTAW